MAEKNSNPILSRVIKAYRNNETLPTKFDREVVIKIAKAAQEGGELGMPSIGKEQLVNKILVEGRADAGTNEFNRNNKAATKLFKELIDRGIDQQAAMYPAAVLDKMQVATRLNIPFERAWNGTGRSIQTNRTGEQHAQRAEEHKNADKDPRNKDLVNLVDRAFKGKLTSQENLMATNDEMITKAILGMPSDSYVFEPVTNMPLTDQAKLAINAKLKYASDKILSTPAGRRQYEQETLGTGPELNQESIVRNLADMYKTAGKVQTRFKMSDYVKDDMQNPIIRTALGLDPEGKNFLAAAEKNNPPESFSIVDRILDFVSTNLNLQNK
jgi:hypothetical protein